LELISISTPAGVVVDRRAVLPDLPFGIGADLMKSVQRRGRWGEALERLCLIIFPAMCATTRFASATTSVPTFHETRAYSHPMPAADTYFGPVADVSSKYVGVLGVRSTQGKPTEFNAFVFDVGTGQHLWTLTRPVPPDNVNFRFTSIAIDGDLAVIGATYEHVPLPGRGIAYNAGAAYVYDLTTGQLKHKLVSDSPQINFLLGSSVDILGDRIAVGSWGNAYLFDATTGAQLAKLNPSMPSSQFGISVALSESAAVVGSNSDRSRGEFTGAAFAFDLATYAEISKFVPADAVAYDNFGIEVAVDDRFAIASGRGGAYVFDVMTGSQLMELALPRSTSTYPNLLDIQGTIALLGDPAIGRAATFDWTTGAALQELVPSDFASNFGGSVAMVGSTAVVGALGKAYQFHVVPEPSGAALLLVALVVTRGKRKIR
jgi:outer membrane protein assembly factor BamB